MRRLRSQLLFALLLAGVIGAPGPGLAQDAERGRGVPGRIIGRVIDHTTKRPIAGAIVSVDGIEGRVLTDQRGGFAIEGIPAGSRLLTVEMIGYATRSETIAVRAGAIHDASVVLAQQAIALDPIHVSVRSGFLEASGFYARRQSSGGDFFTREEIERRRASELTDILRDVPGTRIHLLDAGQRHVRFNRSVGETLAFDLTTEVLPGCEPDLYIDGAIFRYRMPQNASEHRVDGFDVLGLAEVEGVEVYSGPDAPLRYQNPCGVILVWTRRGNVLPAAGRRAAATAIPTPLLPDVPAGTLVRITPRQGDRFTGQVLSIEGDQLTIETAESDHRSIGVNELIRIEQRLGQASLGERTWRGARWGLVVGLVGVALAAAAEEFSTLGQSKTGPISDTSPRKPEFGAKIVGVTTVIGAFLGGSFWRYEHWSELRLR
ncbi:MAG: TonB-dependent receptor [Gemmatimonadetes bacterium]|nr:TonB-dependent receptor [Gemmatimonadota bacterium]